MSKYVWPVSAFAITKCTPTKSPFLGGPAPPPRLESTHRSPESVVCKEKCQSRVGRCMDKQSPALRVKQCVPGFGKCNTYRFSLAVANVTPCFASSSLAKISPHWLIELPGSKQTASHPALPLGAVIRTAVEWETGQSFPSRRVCVITGGQLANGRRLDLGKP